MNENDWTEFNITKTYEDAPDDTTTAECAVLSVKKHKEESKIKPQMWALYGTNKFSACETATKQLDSGQYTVEQSQEIGLYFKKKDVQLDDLLVLPDSASEIVLTQVKEFWTKEEHFRKFGFLWKRGIMLYGPPGSGKTSTLQQISHFVIARGGISIYLTVPELTAHGLRVLREVEPTRKLVVMIEDIDAIIGRWGESDLLAILDGELQIDNVLFIATTNYPERLDKRFKNRPSRFDFVKKIDHPNAAARKIYLLNRNQRLTHNSNELQQWVELTNGFSIAHLKELIISVEVFEVKLTDAINRLKAMSNNISSEDDSTFKGFSK